MEIPVKKQENVSLGMSASLICLGLFYVFVYAVPRVGHANVPSLSIDQSRQALDSSRALMREGKYEQALESTAKLVAGYPRHPVYLDQLATLYGRLKRYPEQVEALHRYMAIAATPSDGCDRLIKAYRELHQLKEMVAICERCVEWEPTNSDLVFALGQAYERSKRFADARKTYERGRKLAPKNPDISLGLARVDLFEGDTASAKQLVSGMLNNAPSAGADALLVMGMVLRSEGRLEEAKTYLERGSTEAPAYTDFYLILGGIAEQQGSTAAASAYYRRALKADPGNESALARLKILGEGGGP